jgi:hypothetical protein
LSKIKKASTMLRLFLKLKSYYLARPNFFVSGSWPPISTNISSS